MSSSLESNLSHHRRQSGDSPAKVTPQRLKRWKSALLDLSLRNRLLNFKETGRTVGLLLSDLGALEDRLAQGRELEICARPWLLSGERAGAEPVGKKERTAGPGPEDPKALASYLGRELEAGRVYADLSEVELDRRLITISRAARSAEQEGGVSTLFLTMGLLTWFDPKRPDVERFAPLLLFPLTLARARAGARFRLSLAEDEARLNPTLLELLGIEHGIRLPRLDTLPTDASGLNVDLILDELRHAVAHLDGWKVREKAHVALLSFTKLLMWNDLERHLPTLLQNPVVRHLAGSGEGEDPPWQHTSFPDPRDLDNLQAPDDNFCPLSADASQLAAIFAAEQGHSFVLEGPPGTGKSQTIANLIAHNITKGRTVLFVSAKLAALEVVHRRLEQVGLAPFCLELHSNRAKKRQVMAQLASALDSGRASHPDGWVRHAHSLGELRQTLNGYVEALHRPRPLGMSVFEVTGRLLELRGSSERIALGGEQILETTASELAAMEDSVDRLAAAAQPLEPVAENPWSAVRAGAWRPEMERQVVSALDRLEGGVRALVEASDAARRPLGLDSPSMSREQLHHMASLSRLLLSAPGVSALLLDGPGWGERRRMVEGWIAAGRRRSARWKPLEKTYSSELLKLPLGQLAERFGRWASAFFLLAWIMLFSARRTLKRVCRTRRIPPRREVRGQLISAQEVRSEDRILEEAQQEARRLLGSRWRGAETDWSELESLLSWCADLRVHMASLTEDLSPAAGAAARARWVRMACDEPELLSPDHPTGEAMTRLVTAWDELDTGRKELVELLTLEPEQAWGPPREPDWPGWLGSRISLWRGSMDLLRPWCLLRAAAGEALALGLEPLVIAMEEGRVEPRSLLRCFRRSWLSAWLDALTAADPVLRGFQGSEHERLRERFAGLDQKLMGLVRIESLARLSQGVPDPAEGAMSGSELGVLLREIQKKRRHMPVRRLFEEIPTLLPRLKPCVLMSPLSVAQFLAPGLRPFDLVVFDEASQLPVHDAIGAIARGSQLIVVGDSRQLPPTSFFQRGDGEWGDDDDLEELESILDEAVAAGLPRCRLRWHYRSRHEHLIAFSNLRYYGGQLLTFPAARGDPERLGVRLIPTDGVYDKGSSRTNRAEAEAVVTEILRRITDPAERSRSIGVVTFNQAQQTLIENLLEDARRARPEIEPFFQESAPEPLFVKNLENVQGDERDVMMFSICYARDSSGKLSMHFGPINHTGGERRLNVAVTRAREQLLVFSSLRPEHMDLTKTRAVGVHHLHAFLRYAADGPQALLELSGRGGDGDGDGAATTLALSPDGDALVADVGRALEDLGWDCRAAVGCSLARVDLAVVDPSDPGSHLLAVEGDGLVYRQGETARDRECLRPAQMERMGWRQHRIWSVDWYRSRETELARLERSLRRAQEEAQRRRAAPNSEPTAPSEPEGAQQHEGHALRRVVAAASRASGASIAGAVPYVASALPTRGTPEGFHDPKADGELREVIALLVREESPLCLERLLRRVSHCWEVARITGRVRRRVLRLLDAETALLEEEVVWSPGADPVTYDGIRVPTSDPITQRAAEEIPPRELANAMRALLRQSGSVPEEDLFRAAAKVFGISRLGRRVRSRLQDALALLLASGEARAQGERVSLPG